MLTFIGISSKQVQKNRIFSIRGLLHLKYERIRCSSIQDVCISVNMVWFKKIGEAPINHFSP